MNDLGERERTAVPAPLIQAPTGRTRADSVRHLLFGSRLGRAFWAALAARLIIGWLRPLAPGAAWLDLLTLIVGLALGVTVAVLAVRLWGIARRRLLWLVRRKLILSYVFIGVVPVVLVIALLLFAGALMFLHVSAFLFRLGFDDLIDDARVVAEVTAVEVQRMGPRAADELLERRVANLSDRFPGFSIAIARRGDAPQRGVPALSKGAWTHAEPPSVLPAWLQSQDVGGLLAYAPERRGDEPRVVARAVRFPDGETTYAVIVDIPVGEQVEEWLRDRTGIVLTSLGVLEMGDGPRPAPGRAAEPATATRHPTTGSWSLNSITFFDYLDWNTGQKGTLTLGIRVGVRDVYERLLAAQSRLGRYSLSELFLIVLGVIAALFLVIEFAALVMGFALARSITGSIHQLFEGTQRVRQGDFRHRIEVRTRDQLGELADSFNQMTGSIETLLRQAEEKRRLEEELRIAREIQMSLLPQRPAVMPGLSVSAFCVPAREVGGDYYDFFHLDERRLGFLIADVAGKGTSAALYMAELKGLLLALSKLHHSPKALLSQANRVLADNLDSRTFITMTYAIADLDAGTLTYARAGHTPLLHYTCPTDGGPQVTTYAPDGLVVGLRIEGIAAKFDAILRECTIPLRPGDVFVLFTDGISEAMNGSADLFGEERLQQLLAEYGHLPADEVRARIVGEVDAFVAEADQHDDMTMILLKVEGDTVGLELLSSSEAAS